MGLLDKFKKNDEPDVKNTVKLYNLRESGKFEEALEFHEKNYKKEDDEAFWYTRGNLLTALQRLEEAINCYIKAIQIKDTYIKAWFRLGQRFFEFGKYSEAREAFTKTSHLENKIDENEWNTIATFYYMLALHLEFEKTKNEKLKEKIPNEIRKLRSVIDEVKNSTDEEFLKYCTDNFHKIVNELEPKIVAEIRHPESIN